MNEKEKAIAYIVDTCGATEEDRDWLMKYYGCQDVSAEQLTYGLAIILNRKFCADNRRIIERDKDGFKLAWYYYDIAKEKSCKMVYFLVNKTTGLVKIGKTTNLRRRMKQLENYAMQLGISAHDLYCPITIYAPEGKHYSELEKKMHKKYAQYRKIGEWFSIDLNTIKKDLDNERYPSLNINNMVVYVDTSDILDLPLPNIRECSAEAYAKYVLCEDKRFIDRGYRLYDYSVYGIPLGSMLEIYKQYHNQRLDDFILSELQTKVFTNTQLYLCKSCP